MTDHYGTDWRPWPIGHSPDVCGPDCGAGYYSDYRQVFDRTFDKIDRYLLLVWQDEGGWWNWQYGWFSWTPDGDLWEHNGGMKATRPMAVTECRRAAEAHIRSVKQGHREYEQREAERLSKETQS